MPRLHARSHLARTAGSASRSCFVQARSSLHRAVTTVDQSSAPAHSPEVALAPRHQPPQSKHLGNKVLEQTVGRSAFDLAADCAC
jgi:hypothetical protein